MVEEKDILTDAEWFTAMEKAEDRLIALSGLPPNEVQKGFVTI